MTDSKNLFQKNLDLLRQKNTLLAYQVEFYSNLQHLGFCETKEEQNLCNRRYGITHYYHSPEGPREEANRIAQTEIDKRTQVIYFYGIGLGYIYEALEEWLKHDPESHLIFLEHDLEVLYFFLYTERATRILEDARVTLFHFTDLEEGFDLFKLISRFINLQIQFLALPFYISEYTKEAFDLCYQILQHHTMLSQLQSEYLSGQTGYLSNFYPNLLELPNSYSGTHLYGKFEHIPAIICGAGPSLEKNIDVLKTLKDRALIFAGGSSLNVVNAYGLVPHFGVAIDPNPEQEHRWLTNDTFNIPTFYRNRVSHSALNLIQGPKIYVPGTPSTPFPGWFEKKLGIEGPPLDEGHNVVNFCTGIAQLMGCNPIIYVGMDLSFDESKTYSTGINIHPLWLGKSTPYARPTEELVKRLSIEGKRIMTKWDWISEAIWISHFASNHPHLTVINATEGGLGFENVPNQRLADVATQYLERSFDLMSRVHGEIQNTFINRKRHEIINLILEFKQSLVNCLDLCKKIIHEESSLENTDATISSLYTTNAILFESLLQDEIGYRYFLEQFESVKSYLDRSKGSNMDPIHQVKQLKEKYQFLTAVISQHIDILQKSMMLFIFSGEGITMQAPPTQKSVQSLDPSSDEVYLFDEGNLSLKDAEMSLSIDLTYIPTIQREYYPSGTLKIETIYDTEGNLQGPSRFYSIQGQLLAESWFVNGKKEGKSRSFYESGNLFSIERYRNGQLHGNQEYFYKNQVLHIFKQYQEGYLNGEVSIHNHEGKLIRSLTYKDGKRNGIERLWTAMDVCQMDCLYQDGTPIGKSRAFDERGALRKEVDIYEYPHDFNLTSWNSAGEKDQIIQHGIEDFSFFYQKKQDQVKILGNSLTLLSKRLDKILELDSTAQVIDSTDKAELMSAKQSIFRLQEMEAELNHMHDAHFERTKEIENLKEIQSNKELNP